MTKYLREHYNPLKSIHKAEATEIFLVEDALTKERFALKIIARAGLLYSEIAAIEQKNLPKIFYVEETDAETYVVEEYLRGENLQDHIERHGEFSEREVVKIGVEICGCLETLHARHIIHRDIKPANLFLTDSGELKLIDFDAARLEKPDSVADTNLIGTPGFAAPEQYGFHQTDERTDIYALGLTLKILAGYKNYRGCLSAVFAKCTEFDPTKRYDSVKNLRRAIILHSKIPAMKKYFVAAMAGVLSFGIYPASINEPPFQENLPVTEKIYQAEPQPVTEKIYQAEPQPVTEKIYQAEPQPVTEKIYQAEPQPVTENIYQAEPQPVAEKIYQAEPASVEKIIAETAQKVSEQDLEPPPRMPRRDFAARMSNLNLSDKEIDAEQEKYQRRLEMNQRIKEFQKQLPEDLDEDTRREAFRVYALQESEKLKE